MYIGGNSPCLPEKAGPSQERLRMYHALSSRERMLQRKEGVLRILRFFLRGQGKRHSPSSAFQEKEGMPEEESAGAVFIGR